MPGMTFRWGRFRGYCGGAHSSEGRERDERGPRVLNPAVSSIHGVSSAHNAEGDGDAHLGLPWGR